jgi:hypothetical protein
MTLIARGHDRAMKKSIAASLSIKPADPATGVDYVVPHP